ncbi:MAG: endolytic transglycosylase MltG [Chitinophagales bacterium]
MKKKTWRIIIVAVLIVIAVVVVYGYDLYKKVMIANVAGDENVSIFISQEDNLDSLKAQMQSEKILKDEAAFDWWAHKKQLGNNLHPGRYVLKPGLNNREIVNLLMSGRQTPLNVIFNNIRTKKDFAGRIGGQLEPDSIDFIHYFDTTTYFNSAGLNKDNFMTLFIPNTYELYWTTTAEGFVKRMAKEHERFWTDERLNKAKAIDLTPEEVYILASIVYSENERASGEAKRIAGVYMNRLKINMLLQADPTLKFAIGDFAKKRIYDEDKLVESPYNTYKYLGLPPGPIHMPPIIYIDAVLNYEHHEYIYMCARGEGSGLHYFAKTLTEHNRNSDLYHKALDAAGIR